MGRWWRDCSVISELKVTASWPTCHCTALYQLKLQRGFRTREPPGDSAQYIIVYVSAGSVAVNDRVQGLS